MLKKPKTLQLRFEEGHPYVFGFVAFLLVTVFGTRGAYACILTGLGSGVVAGSIFVGFIATALSIIMTLDNTAYIDRVKEANVYERVLGYLWNAVTASFILVAVSIALEMLRKATWFGDGKPWVAGVWLGLLVYTLLAGFRGSRFIYLMIRFSAKQPAKREAAPVHFRVD